MAKAIFKIEIESLGANKTKNGTLAQFANNVQQTEKGPVSRTSITFNIPDMSLTDKLVPGKKYTVTITEE